MHWNAPSAETCHRSSENSAEKRSDVWPCGKAVPALLVIVSVVLVAVSVVLVTELVEDFVIMSAMLLCWLLLPCKLSQSVLLKL